MITNIFLILLTIIATGQSLKSVKIWQRKEYRFDKINDFFHTTESVKFVFDVPFFVLIFFSILQLFNSINGVQYLLFISLFFAIFWLGAEAFEKKLTPVLTAKSVIIFLLTVIIIDLGVIGFYFSNLVIFLLPLAFPFIATFLAVLLFYPLDLYVKKRIWNRAKIRRLSLLNSTKVIAVSGSYGKTTVKEFLAQCLATTFKTEKTLNYENTTISVGKKVLLLPAATEMFVCEIGAYRVGDGIDICVFALPNAAIITGLNDQHYSLFGSRENIIQAESESLQFLKPKDFVFINMNCQMCRKIKVPSHLQLIRYGLTCASKPKIMLDYAADEIYFDGEFTQFTLVIGNKRIRLKTNALSMGNIQNLIGAIAVAHTFGVALTAITEAITNLTLPQGTLELLPYTFGTVINDSHNANVDGILNAFLLVKQFNRPSIIVLDEVMELGDKAEEAHKNVANSLFELKPQFIVLLGKSYPKITYNQLMALGYPPAQILLSDGANLDYIQQIVNEKIQELTQKSEKITVLCEGFRSSSIVKAMV